MEFLEEEAFEPGGARGGPPRRRAMRGRQILVRRLIALGVGAVLVILVILGIKGCLNARKERSFQNYVSDLSSLVAQTSQLSTAFFGQLNDPGKLSQADFESQINSYAGTASGLVNNLKGISTPDELKDDQGQIILAFELRQQGLAGVAANMKNALGGGTGRTDAINNIANFMSYLLASDVLYAQARQDIDKVLADQGIEVDGKQARAPESVFLQDRRWLDPTEVSIALAAVGSQATTGTHGLALLQTTIKPGDTVLSPDTPVKVSAGGQPEVDVQVQNQGDQNETDVGVSIEITGGPQTITGNTTIPKILPGGTETAAIAIKPAPPTGQEVTLQVSILPVPGETLTTNNESTYQLTFGAGG